LEIDNIQQRLKQGECQRNALEGKLAELRTQKAEADSRTDNAEAELKTLSEKVAVLSYTKLTRFREIIFFCNKKIVEGNFRKHKYKYQILNPAKPNIWTKQLFRIRN
jgi:chromosome segregation ATPase